MINVWGCSAEKTEKVQTDLFNTNPLLEKLKSIEPDSTSPKQALELLYELKDLSDNN